MRKNGLICLLLFAILIGCASCSAKNERSARALMEDFLSIYGAGGILFSPDLPEGEIGYCGEDFFADLFGRTAAGVRDYAVFLLARPDGAGECAVFVCASAYDARGVLELCENRLELIRSLAIGTDVSAARDAFFLRSGNTVVFCALYDNAAARRAWERVL